MRRSGGCVGVTSTPKHTEVIVAGRGTKKSVVWCGGRVSRGGQAVKEIGGGVEAQPRSKREARPVTEGCV